MVIVPSIDVRGARVVGPLAAGGQLRGGHWPRHPRAPSHPRGVPTPSEVAARYVAEGAEELHLVDLDSAEGGHDNLALLAAIARRSGVPCRLAGGISSVDLAREAIDAGFAGVLFSSAVFGDDDLLRDVASLEDRAIVEIEARDGYLAPRGGDPGLVQAARGRGALAAARAAVIAGIRHLYVIDLGTEGALAGPPLALLEEVRSSLGERARHVAFHAGGGIGSLDHVRALALWGAASVVVGTALAQGRFTIEEAKEAAGASTNGDPKEGGAALH